MITWHTCDESTYKTTRYNLLYWVEENGNPKTTPYIVKGEATMGIGFNLTVPANMEAILTEIGFDLSATGKEKQYIDDLIAAGRASNISQLNTIMNQWANDTTVITHNDKDKRSTFFLDYDEINNVFNAIAPRYELLIDKWITKYDLSVERYSRERAVFYSLAYNSKDVNPADGIPDLLGKGLGTAIKNGNRAEAWYEIRYGSNGDHSDGIAKRRYYESDLFGLYNNPGSVDETESKTILRMYTLHKDDIISYDNTYGAQVAKANTDFNVTWVKTLTENLQSAKDLLITNFAQGRTIDEVIVGKGLTTYEYKDQGNYTDNLTGTNNNDLIFGERGDDTIRGGKGNDILIGGEGVDTYYYKAGDGSDWINDTGTNNIIIEKADGTKQKITNFYETGDNIWTTPDGKIDITHHSPWQIVLEDGSTLTLGENFADGDFGIKLRDIPSNPSTSNEIIGDQDPEDKTDAIFDTTLNDRIEGRIGNDGIWASKPIISCIKPLKICNI